MRREIFVVLIGFILILVKGFYNDLLALKISEATSDCISCHADVTPGIVSDWKSSLHAKITLKDALKKSILKREISISKFPKEIPSDTVIGCAECHGINSNLHKDTFDHNGYKVHVVVTPKDCSICHPVEVREYDENLMSHAYKNLNNNIVYHMLAKDTLKL